jgi:hypothetical protein
VTTPKQILLNNLKSLYLADGIQANASANVAQDLVLKINERLIDRYPELFANAPVVDENAAELITYRFTTRCSLERIVDDTARNGEEAAIDDVVDDLAIELQNLGYPNFYIPVFSPGVIIDPDRFEPIICFISRYVR